MGERICSIEDCVKPVVARGWCRMHYGRWHRHGDPLINPKPVVPEVCAIDGCDSAGYARGVCKAHHHRLLAYGSPLGQPAREPSQTYHAIHKAVRASRGRAALHACVDCGEPAREWSYDHMDPDELIHDDGRRYSLSHERYQPRCTPCHRIFDRND